MKKNKESNSLTKEFTRYAERDENTEDGNNIQVDKFVHSLHQDSNSSLMLSGSYTLVS